MDAQEDAEIKTYQQYKYPTMSKTIGNFKLTVMEGEFTDSQIVVMLGENGTGKTTFIRMLVDLSPPFPPPPLSLTLVLKMIQMDALHSRFIYYYTRWNKYGRCLVLSLPPLEITAKLANIVQIPNN